MFFKVFERLKKVRKWEMAIADPRGIYQGGIGKDVPAMGPFRNYQPKIQGPGSGKIKAIISGGKYVYGYFKKNPRFAARIGAVAGGAVVKYATYSTRRKTPFAKKSFYSSKRSYYSDKYRVRDKRSCCCVRSPRKRRIYY